MLQCLKLVILSACAKASKLDSRVLLTEVGSQAVVKRFGEIIKRGEVSYFFFFFFFLAIVSSTEV